MGKIVSREELAKIVQELKKQGKKIVTTNGAFDIIHIGHVRSLQQAKSFGGILVVGVNSDSSVKQYKGDRRPINPENDRAEMIASLACVDYVTIFAETTPNALLEVIRPGIHVKSGEYDPEKMPETPVVRKHGGEVRITPYIKGRSTTEIIKKVCDVYGQNNN